MTNGKILKRGDYLFKEFDKISAVYIVQSGQLSLTTFKNKKSFELTTVGAGYVFADHILLGIPSYSYSALALQECKIVELPVEIFKEQFESFHTVFRSFMKTQSDKLKWALNELKNKKSDRESIACANEELVKVFGSVLTLAKTRGVQQKDFVQLDWTMLRNQNQRLFHEPPRRTEQAISILCKLGFAEFVKQDPEDGNVVRLKAEIESVKMRNLAQAEAMLEFFQYAYYKSGSSELLRVDETHLTLLQILVSTAIECKPDYQGVVSVDYNQVSARFAEYGIRLGPNTFHPLESRGLVCRIKSTDTSSGKTESPVIQFDQAEFEVALNCWKLLKEVEKWNEKGLVDDEAPIVLKKKPLMDEKLKCGSCGFEQLSTAKFCSECGAKVGAQDLSDQKKKAAA